MLAVLEPTGIILKENRTLKNKLKFFTYLFDSNSKEK